MSDLAELRKKAEVATKDIGRDDLDFDLSHISMEQLKALTHELKVYQIELEMQNEELRETQTHLTHVKEQYQELFESAPVGYFIINAQSFIQSANATGCYLLQEEKSKLLKNTLYSYVDKQYQSLFSNHIHFVIKHNKSRQDELKIHRKDGRVFYALIESSVIENPEGDDALLRLVINDIDELFKMRKREKLAAEIIENSIEGIIITDKHGKILSINSTFTKITGYSKSEVIGQSPNILNSGKHAQAFYEKMWNDLANKGHWEGEIWNRRKDGEVYQEWLDIRSVKDNNGNFSSYVGKFTDLSTTKEAQTRLHFLAHFDLLTELPNRTMFNDRLAQSINTADRSGKKIVLFFMDLDGFKAINDSLGHEFGDKLLQHVAKRLLSTIRKIDTVSRLGGDEFTVIANEIENTDQCVTLAEKLLNSFTRPFIIEHRRIFIGTSFGISIFPDDGIRGSDLIKYADTAMYQAKEKGRNQYCFYTQKMGKIANERMQLEHELHNAIENDQLCLHYQPQYDLATGRLTGMEALVRWYHPKRGLVFPGDFIPQAEKTNLILALGDWVLNKACEQGGKWLRSGKQPLRIAVNISPKQFQNNGFEVGLKKILSKHGLPGEWLELEITEKSLITEVDKVIKILNLIKKLDVTLAIDDFGTGYSSMNYLKRFTIDVLKIDRSFIKDIAVDKDDEAIITSIIALAHGLNLTVLAEGVETQAQHDFLAQLNCNQSQGFLYHKPMTAEEISLHLK